LSVTDQRGIFSDEEDLRDDPFCSLFLPKLAAREPLDLDLLFLEMSDHASFNVCFFSFESLKAQLESSFPLSSVIYFYAGPGLKFPLAEILVRRCYHAAYAAAFLVQLDLRPPGSLPPLPA